MFLYYSLFGGIVDRHCVNIKLCSMDPTFSQLKVELDRQRHLGVIARKRRGHCDSGEARREGELVLEEQEGRGEWKQSDSPHGHCLCVFLCKRCCLSFASGLFKPELPLASGTSFPRGVSSRALSYPTV